MAKRPILDDVGNILNGAPTINANNDAIEESFDNTLSRDGSTPNQMEADLDMNGNDILNVGEIYVGAINVPVEVPNFYIWWFNTTHYLTLDEVPCAVEMNHSGPETLYLPTGAEVGTLVTVVQAGTGTTTVSAQGDETMNGVTNGSCELNEQYAEVSFTMFQHGWNATGARGAVS